VKRIIKTEFKRSAFSPTTINAMFDDGSREDILSFYEDEISFSEYELVGMTKSEASMLQFKKDKAYLQS